MEIKSLLTQSDLESGILQSVNVEILIFILIAVVILKGVAMWRASKRNSRVWFWVLLLVNSMGLLPALYLINTRKK